MTDQIVVLGLLGLFGLAIGSFVNVVAYRVPLKRSVLSPRSQCPNCQHPISWRENIPVVSWILLRGRCSECGAGISARYLVVEVSTAVVFAGTAAVIGIEPVLPAYLWFAGVTITLVLTDIDHKLIPNRILYPGIIVGAVLLVGGALISGDSRSAVRALLAGGAYFGALLVIALVAPAGGFGFGDVKLAVLLGLFTGYLGWGHVSVAFFFAFLLGGVLSILLLLTGLKGRKDAIPFGPYLVLGAYVAIVAGDNILDWYLV
jgi:leader peptidase (prepilin peptidase) / N-methyltransferase